MTTLNTKIKFRNDLSTNWETLNPILLKGEPGYDTQKKIFKVGDGVSPWNTLESIVSEATPIVTPTTFSYPGSTLVDAKFAGSPENMAIANTDILYAIGTNFGQSSYSNILTSGAIDLFWSDKPSYWHGPANNIFDRTNPPDDFSTYYNGYITLDFKARKIKLNKLAFQDRPYGGSWGSIQYRLSYSDDNVNFFNSVTFSTTGITGHWDLVDIGLNSGYRYWKLQTLSGTAPNLHPVLMGGILLWGEII